MDAIAVGVVQLSKPLEWRPSPPDHACRLGPWCAVSPFASIGMHYAQDRDGQDERISVPDPFDVLVAQQKEDVAIKRLLSPQALALVDVSSGAAPSKKSTARDVVLSKSGSVWINCGAMEVNVYLNDSGDVCSSTFPSESLYPSLIGCKAIAKTVVTQNQLIAFAAPMVAEIARIAARNAPVVLDRIEDFAKMDLAGAVTSEMRSRPAM